MQLLAIIVLSASVLLAGLQLWPSATVDGIRAASSKAGAASEVEKYRVFMYAADTYMKSSPPSVSVTTSVDWSTIKTLTTLPASVRATEMPSGWRIVRAVDNTWVACTELSAEALNTLQQKVTRPGLVASGGYSLQGMNGVMAKLPTSVTPPFGIVPVTVSAGTATVALVGGAARTVDYTVLGSTAEAPAAALQCAAP